MQNKRLWKVYARRVHHTHINQALTSCNNLLFVSLKRSAVKRVAPAALFRRKNLNVKTSVALELIIGAAEQSSSLTGVLKPKVLEQFGPLEVS